MVGKLSHAYTPLNRVKIMCAIRYTSYPMISILFVLFFFLQNIHAENSSLHVTILSYQKAPVEEVIVNASPVNPAKATVSIKNKIHQMVQKNRVFSPSILAIQVGEQVRFPNQDSIKHHVYSFSKPKVFQLKLYKDHSPEPIEFDKPGIVSIGCNIHDWMIGHIYIADSPYFNKTDAKGTTEIQLPNGVYKIQFWHPIISVNDQKQTKIIDIQNDTKITFILKDALAKLPKKKSSNKFWRNY